MGNGWDLPMGSPARTLTMKTSITPGNFIRRRISLMLNKLPDWDVPAEDDIWVNTLLIQVKGRKQETLRLCSGSPPKSCIWGGWELVPSLHDEEPSETVGLPPLSDQTNPQQGVHDHLFWDTSLGWKTAILHGTVINIFRIKLSRKHSLDTEVPASRGWDCFALKCNSKVLQQFLQHVNPLSLFTYYLSETPYTYCSLSHDGLTLV